MEDYDYSFSQNGLVAYKAGKLIAEQVRKCAHLSVHSCPGRLCCVSYLPFRYQRLRTHAEWRLVVWGKVLGFEKISRNQRRSFPREETGLYVCREHWALQHGARTGCNVNKASNNADHDVDGTKKSRRFFCIPVPQIQGYKGHRHECAV